MAECNSCGGFVTDDYVRVFGDNEGNVSDCRNCRARSDDAEEEESGEREVLLREVTGTTVGDTTQSGSGSETERPGAGGTASGDGGSSHATSDTARAGGGPAAGSTRTAGGTTTRSKGRSGAASESATTQEAEAASGSADGESAGARERLAGLLSSLRG